MKRTIGSEQFRRQRQRHGIVSMIALVGLIIAGTIAFGVVRAGMVSREQVRTAARQQQIEQIYLSAARRAEVRLMADAEYREEAWVIAAADVPQLGETTATMNVEPVAEMPGTYRVSMKIRCDNEPTGEGRAARVIEIVLPQERK